MEDAELQEEEGGEDEDVETMIQCVAYTSHRDREMTEDMIDDMGAYDDNGLIAFES
jgi:hypothetical protein